MDPLNKINYYVEPVEVEIYLKKSGIVRTIIKEMYIDLVDVMPNSDHSKKIFDFFTKKKEPIDLIEIMNIFPQYMPVIFESYYHRMQLYEKASMHYKEAQAGSIDSLRLSLYFTELLIKYEPTVASASYLGDFQTYNLNYLIRKLNEHGQKFLLEDSTTRYLIKRRNTAFENKPKDREFDKLVELWEYNVKKGKTI